MYFYEGIRYEDNLYTLQVLLGADRVQFVNKKFFHRRVRSGSTMTSQEGYPNFYGYWVTYCEALHFLANSRMDERVNKEVEKEIRYNYMGNALRIWGKLDEREKAEFYNTAPRLYRILFDAITVKSNDKLSKELSDIRHGYSFRIGRIVTWAPRKIRGGIHCIQQHGLVYTVKRVLEHLGIDMGTGDFKRRK